MAGAIGFDAITVALLGRATPLGTVLAGLLFGALSVGGVAMQASAGTPKELTQVLQALIVLFVAAPALVQADARIKADRRRGQTVAGEGMGRMSAAAWRHRADGSRSRPGRHPAPDQAGRGLRLWWPAVAVLRAQHRRPDGELHPGERFSADDRPRSSTARPSCGSASVVALVALALAAVNQVPRAAWACWSTVLVGVAFFAGFIIWSYADQSLGRPLAIVNPLPGTVQLATPLVFGALAGCLCERAGVINIAIEGQFLMGAFFASVASSLAYSAPRWVCSAASWRASPWPPCWRSSRFATRSTRWSSASC